MCWSGAGCGVWCTPVPRETKRPSSAPWISSPPSFVSPGKLRSHLNGAASHSLRWHSSRTVVLLPNHGTLKKGSIRIMPGKVVTVTSGKGGVGKTTATANIGAALAAAGKKVICVDADIGLRNLDVVLGLENRIVYDLVDVVEGVCRLKQALIRDKRFKGLYLLPAAQTRDKNAVTPAQMQKLCEDLKQQYDFV